MQDVAVSRWKFSMPIVIGYLPVGLACGLLLSDAGLAWWQVILMSTLVFGGSSQFLAAALLAQDANWIEIFISVLLLSSRQGLYSISLAPYLKTVPRFKAAWLNYMTADESYAVNIVNLRDSDETHPWFINDALFVATATWLSWAVFTAMGAIFGTFIEIPEVISNFVMVAMFIGILVPNIRNRMMLTSMIGTGLLSIVLMMIFQSSYVIIMVTAITLAVVFYFLKRQDNQRVV
ncbi:AzlC family ABC transporter permease [Aerococcus sp. 1KP-2016]|uniref:AzlC family ABC transporter permease n=1 Tax=Aerococcus sp. 1KP-2016 TaxID=1981982 RepID=UPI000B994239|nr:AzlC family ABC transporter permease [Aerococcus sp. 1KP-2016]OYQ66925.1 branched-chain amino acid transporter AzlC [Aerococcus sp. 1KP-2016]